MGWVVDQRLRKLKESAVRELQKAGGAVVGATTQQKRVESRAHSTLGHGHHEGDHILADIAAAIASCGKAHASILVAIAEAKQINIRRWEPDDGASR